MGLVAHCGSVLVKPLELYGVATPEETKTWKPVPHGQVRDTLLRELESRKIGIESEQWALLEQKGAPGEEGFRPLGARMFGVITLGSFPINGPDTGSLAIGVRNSHDQSIGLQFAPGSRVFVCDNMSFVGDQVIGVKHLQSRLDLDNLVHDAVAHCHDKYHMIKRFVSALKRCGVDNSQMDEITCKALRRSVVSGAQAKAISTAWHDRKALPCSPPGFATRLEQGVYEDRTAWSAHGLFTEFLKTHNPFTKLTGRHRTINSVFAEEIPNVAYALN